DNEATEQSGSQSIGGGQERGKSPVEAFEAFNLFRAYLDAQLKDFKQDLVSQVAKPKISEVPKFQKVGNKIQFEFNSEILEGLEKIYKLPRLENISSIASGLIDKVKRRNKLIRVADNSPGGWLTVAEYEKPNLGSDSEDEKKIKQAESKAVKRIKALTPSSTHVNPNPYKRPSVFTESRPPRGGMDQHRLASYFVATRTSHPGTRSSVSPVGNGDIFGESARWESSGESAPTVHSQQDLSQRQKGKEINDKYLVNHICPNDVFAYDEMVFKPDCSI
ncbi:MAG: hypothetical protein ABW185_02645, partial [Sedimenticola sp.]